MDLTQIINPAIDRDSLEVVRTPALLYYDGYLWCYHTVAMPGEGSFLLHVGVSRS